jgi:hypothetical protein
MRLLSMYEVTYIQWENMYTLHTKAYQSNLMYKISLFWFIHHSNRAPVTAYNFEYGVHAAPNKSSKQMHNLNFIFSGLPRFFFGVLPVLYDIYISTKNDAKLFFNVRLYSLNDKEIMFKLFLYRVDILVILQLTLIFMVA